MNNCYGGVIDNCLLSDMPMPGIGYGISVGSSQEISIQNCTIEACRHGIGLVGSYPSKNIIISSNKINLVAEWGATGTGHGINSYNAEKVIINGNSIRNGSISTTMADYIISNN
jgi:nitrous oxidase accessory protein NosD